MTGHWYSFCTYQTVVSSTLSFLTYESTLNQLSVATTDACDIGLHTSIGVTLSPTEVPKIRADEIYSLNVEITCAVTSVALATAL